jgi:hypothetical protein
LSNRFLKILPLNFSKLDLETNIDGIKLAIKITGMPDKDSIDYTEFNDIFDVIKSGFKVPEISEEQSEEIEDVFAIFDKAGNTIYILS